MLVTIKMGKVLFELLQNNAVFQMDFSKNEIVGCLQTCHQDITKKWIDYCSYLSV